MTTPVLPLTVELELHRALASVVERCGPASFRRQVRDRLRELMRELGLSGDVDVVISGRCTRAVCVRTSGIRLSYQPSWLLRLWFGIASDELRQAADSAAST